MRSSNNSLNSVDADFAATFPSVPDHVEETAAAASIAEDDEDVFLDDIGGAVGRR